MNQAVTESWKKVMDSDRNKGLMNSFVSKYRKHRSGLLDDVEVYHDTEHRIFYFSPPAAKIAPQELQELFTDCVKPANLADLRRVEI